MYDFELFTSILHKTAFFSCCNHCSIFLNAYCIWCACLCSIVYESWIGDINDEIF